MEPRVAVIDIGSNSIKVLVAERNSAGSIAPVYSRTIEARISAGISGEAPRLRDEGMDRGVAAVRALLADAARHAPARTLLVATSAVRDAGNGDEFRERVVAETGQDIRILSGDEEAAFIGRGVLTDPALSGVADLEIFDLGGGSLECISLRGRKTVRAISLRLGCVRLTERFVADPSLPMDSARLAAVENHVRRTLAEAGIGPCPSGTVAVAMGGTAATARAIASPGARLEDAPALLETAELERQLRILAGLPLADRRRTPGLAPQRADVFPVALATLLALARQIGVTRFRHSLRNLRYGIADELLK